MPTLEEIKSQITGISELNAFLGRKEIKELPKILWDDEKVEKLVQGRYNGGYGVLVATNKRVIFIDKGIFSLKVEDFPFDKISSIQYETGFLSGKLTLFTSGNKAIIEKVDKAQVRVFGDWLRARISTKTNNPLEAAVASISKEDVIAKLEKLGKLKNEGLLTEEEFQQQKNVLLNS